MSIKSLFAIVGALALNFLLVLAHSAVYDVKIVPETCKKSMPVQTNYKPLGTTRRLGDMDIYETPYKGKTSQVVLFVYDIFGFHNNTKQNIDNLAAQGNFRIVMPDYLRGKPLTESSFPPKDEKELQNYLESHSWEKHIRKDTIAVLNDYKKTTGQDKFGMFGNCWGGRMTVEAASELSEVKVSAIVHPSSVPTELAKRVKAPMFLLPSQDEPDMIPFFKILRDRLGRCNTGHRRFDDAPHGFMGARSNYSDPAQVRAIKETTDIISQFFQEELSINSTGLRKCSNYRSPGLA